MYSSQSNVDMNSVDAKNFPDFLKYDRKRSDKERQQKLDQERCSLMECAVEIEGLKV
jgi:hypothetical protein